MNGIRASKFHYFLFPILQTIIPIFSVTAFSCTINKRATATVTKMLQHKESGLSEDGAVWCPETQTFIGGVPRHSETTLTIDELLARNGDKLKIFGYGSLCWHPGADGVLSLANIEQDEHDNEDEMSSSSSQPKRKVTTASGRAIGYRRCWAQRSADHRGDTDFNGIVCTLLSDDEFAEIQSESTVGEHQQFQQSMTEGLIYTVDRDLVEDCLAELDFREKGGYARDTIDVIEDDTGKKFKALLYRGTAENPAFWKRALLDLPLAAAVMSVAQGPSGPNDFYLMQLDKFLTHAAMHSAATASASALDQHSGDEDTGKLARMCKMLQTDYTPLFLFGSGSNEHNQLLLNLGNVSVEERHELSEMLLVIPRIIEKDSQVSPQSLHAGGGHSALLTNAGELYLWGWNDSGQLGRMPNTSAIQSKEVPFSGNIIQPLEGIKVDTVSLGHNHSILIEKGSRKLFCFGENGRGQVSGNSSNNASIHTPFTPPCLSSDEMVDVAAGLFHSAAITIEGELVTWGCGRFCQSLPTDSSTSNVGRWRPEDGVKLKQVSCGRRHTVILDEIGRVWTLGDNKYGQLGRLNTSKSAVPELVSGPLGRPHSGCVEIHCGWSHTVAVVKDDESTRVTLFGWGRNDKGQLGFKSAVKFEDEPQELLRNNGDIEVASICCGAESSLIIDTNEKIWSCGWNEHGNLGFKSSECCFEWRLATGSKIVSPPTSSSRKILAACGGAHIIVMKG